MAARVDLRGRTWQLALAGVAVLLGIAAGVDPRIAVAGAIGLAFVALVMADLTIGLCLFAVVAGYGILTPPQDVAYYEVTRVSGTIGDPNELAAVLVGGTVLAAGLAATLKNAPLLRLAAGAAAALCAAGIFLSLSRGGLVALGFSLVAPGLVAGRRWRGQAVALAVVIAAGGFVYFGFYASTGAASRVTSLRSGTGRTDIWTVGWRMVEAHPANGVGVGNYQTSAVH